MIGKKGSSVSKRWNDLIIINILVIILIGGILYVPSSSLRAFLGFPFILVFPGYILTIALFPTITRLDGVGRLALSLGLSVAVIGIISLVLNFTSLGITLETLLWSVVLFIFLISIIAWFRQSRFLPEERYGTRQLKLSLNRGKTVREKTLMIILIVVILGTLSTAGFALFTPKVGQTFTEFYILGTGSSVDYPQQIQVGVEGQVLLGIINHEAKTNSYSVAIYIAGIKVNEIGTLTLNVGEKWEQTVTFVPQTVGIDQEVEFILYKNGDTKPYMEPLRLWIDVTQ